MTKIEIYDEDYKKIEKLASEEYTTIAEVVADILVAFKIHVLDEED